MWNLANYIFNYKRTTLWQMRAGLLICECIFFFLFFKLSHEICAHRRFYWVSSPSQFHESHGNGLFSKTRRISWKSIKSFVNKSFAIVVLSVTVISITWKIVIKHFKSGWFIYPSGNVYLYTTQLNYCSKWIWMDSNYKWEKVEREERVLKIYKNAFKIDSNWFKFHIFSLSKSIGLETVQTKDFYL